MTASLTPPVLSYDAQVRENQENIQKRMLKAVTNELYMMRIVESEAFLYHIFFGLSLEQKVIDLKPLSWSGKEKEASSG